MPIANVNLINVANQAFDGLPVEIVAANRPAETLPASTAVVNTPVANQGFGRGVAKNISGATH